MGNSLFRFILLAIAAVWIAVRVPIQVVFPGLVGTMVTWIAPIWTIVLCALIFFVIHRLYREAFNWWHRQEQSLSELPLLHVLSRFTGMVLGLLMGFMLYPALTLIEPNSGLIPLMIDILLGLLGYRIGKMKENEWHIIKFSRASHGKNSTEVVHGQHDKHEAIIKLLDTSAIIDGRIADLTKTGFIDGKVIVPDFVIQELQQIADSSDMLRRNRGRRGLDILQQIQRENPELLQIVELRLEQGDVDTRLVKIAKRWRAKVITNDYNLNKVCELHGVCVLNLNDLSNAMKPLVLPGQVLSVQILRDGKESGQGIGYLEDGTMVVVDGGREVIGQTADVIVSSVLQTSAGKMVFSKRKTSETVAATFWSGAAVQ